MRQSTTDATDADHFWLGPERRAFVVALRDFAERERGGSSHSTAPAGGEAHDQELYERLARTGYLGVSVAEPYGGGGGGLVDSCLLMEEASLPRETSMLKLKVTETAKHIALEGMQMMGGDGYATEYGMEGQVRSALVGTIFGGTSEVQRDVIGKTLGL